MHAPHSHLFITTAAKSLFSFQHASEQKVWSMDAAMQSAGHRTTPCHTVTVLADGHHSVRWR